MRDQNTIFDNAAALTSSRTSTHTLNLGPLAAGNASRNIGEANNQLYLIISVPTALTSSGSSTLAWALQTDDNTGFSTATTFPGFGETIAKSRLTKDAFFVYPLPPGAYEQYARLSYTVATADFTGGAITAEISMNPPGRNVLPVSGRV